MALFICTTKLDHNF